MTIGITAAGLASASVFVAALSGASDPRPRLVELARSGETKSALGLAESGLESDPVEARALGLDFLRAQLLERLGRAREANEAYAQSLASSSPLAPWSRYHLALAQDRSGHPEVAAGLAATLLAQSPPEQLSAPTLKLLERTLERGGDCRLLRGIPRERFSGDERRLRELLELKCEIRDGGPDAEAAFAQFLSQRTDDAYAWEAVAALDESRLSRLDKALAQRAGFVAYVHREFELALRLLGAPLPRPGPRTHDLDGYQLAYAAARSAFWLGRYREAAERFEAISREGLSAAVRSDALYQRARSLELAEEREAARAGFVRAFQEDTTGDRAGAALLGALRIELTNGDDSSARRRLSSLAGVSVFSVETARGAMFVAVSDLVRGQAGRSSAMLSLAERTTEASNEELSYWRGRQAELRGDLDEAIDEYLTTCERRPFHPLAQSARRRLASARLAQTIAARRAALAAEGSPRSSWQLEALSENPLQSAAWRRKGLDLLSSQAASATWIDARPIPVRDWNLWKATLSRPDELLLALGLPAEGATAVPRHFPASRPQTGLTGAQLLAGGPATRRGIQIAEISFRRRPSQVPFEWVDPTWLSVLYPLPWAEIVLSQARARGVDPALLAAIIREESRFDPEALSAASARGLTQFVLPTARRLAPAIGLGSIRARDLHDPMVAIPLGAAYLAQLAERFRGDEISMAAAYNAGEDQVVLWRRYCLSAEPEELLTKIGFGETRAYVVRVLESREIYRRLLSRAPR